MNEYEYKQYNCYHFIGENVLHIAIADNNSKMLMFFLRRLREMLNEEQKGSKNLVRYARHFLNQKACGFFFLPADQSKQRKFILQNERYHLPRTTNYKG